MQTTDITFRPAGREGLGQGQWIALVAPVVLVAVMYPIFQMSDALFGEAAGGYLGWYAGLAIYWVLWGWLFSTWIVGRDRILELLRPRRPAPEPLAIVAFVVAMAVAVRFLVPGMGYDLDSFGVYLLLVSSTVGNGVFEETLWRGVYLRLFTGTWLRVLWPSLWFGLWHLVPGSISADGAHLAMVIGPFFMGLILAFLARRSDSVWWPALAHTLGGLVMIS